jgi:hypothetical protein
MRRSHIIFALVGALCLAGCSWSEKVESKVAPDMVSLADRCGSLMQAAMPFAQIDLGDRSSRSPDVRTIVATVNATRTDVPKDVAGGRDLTAECTFVDNVLAGFRWTRGGPPPPIGSEQAQPGSGTSQSDQIPPPSGVGMPGNRPAPTGKTQPFH